MHCEEQYSQKYLQFVTEVVNWPSQGFLKLVSKGEECSNPNGISSVRSLQIEVKQSVLFRKEITFSKLPAFLEVRK